MQRAARTASPSAGPQTTRLHDRLPSLRQHRVHSLGSQGPALGVSLKHATMPLVENYQSELSADDMRDEGRFRELSTWIESSGGYVHPALKLVDYAPCGCRGVVVQNPVDVEELRSAPLVLVPEQLYMTSQSATVFFSDTIPLDLMHVFVKLPGPVQLALFLAVQQQYGSQSFWYPYISNLPDDPPCAWWWDEAALRQYIKNNELPSGWIKQIRSFRETALQQLQALTARFDVLQLSCTSAAWSYGQVLSRCFGNDANVGLAPLIDLLNHNSSAGVPEGVELDGEQFVYVTSTHFGEPRPLQAGDEVYISYIRKCDPYKTLLNFGFIPPEMLQQKLQTTKPQLQPLTLLNLNHQGC